MSKHGRLSYPHHAVCQRTYRLQDWKLEGFPRPCDAISHLNGFHHDDHRWYLRSARQKWPWQVATLVLLSEAVCLHLLLSFKQGRVIAVQKVPSQKELVMELVKLCLPGVLMSLVGGTLLVYETTIRPANKWWNVIPLLRFYASVFPMHTTAIPTNAYNWCFLCLIGAIQQHGMSTLNCRAQPGLVQRHETSPFGSYQRAQTTSPGDPEIADECSFGQYAPWLANFPRQEGLWRQRVQAWVWCGLCQIIHPGLLANALE